MNRWSSFLLEKTGGKENSFLKFLLCWLVLFTFSIVVRLPHFLSKNFWFDGDEAIIGIMAQDLLAGTNFPIYFYGQNYGLSTFEVLSTALFEWILGPGTWTLRLGGLLLFSLGVTFVLRGIRNYSLPRWVVLSIAVLMITFPTWYLWGGMVRGGYVTAFLFVCIIFYFMLQMKGSGWQLLWIGIASGIAFESHFLILLSFGPIMAWWLFRQEQYWRKALFILVVFVAVVALFRYWGYTSTVFWEPPKVDWGMKDQFQNVMLQVEGLLAGFSSFSYFEMSIERPVWWNVLLVFLLLSGISLLVIDCFRSTSAKRRYYLLVAGSVLVYLFLISTSDIVSPRYWIGLFTGLLFWVILAVVTGSERNTSAVLVSVLAAVSLVGIASGSKMKHHWLDVGVNEQQAFHGLYEEAEKNRVKAIFVTDNLLQYQWNYLYGQKIPASAFRQRERTQTFCDKVNRIYSEHPDQVALGGLWGIFLSMDLIDGFNDDRYQVETKYFLNLNAREDFVAQGMKYILERGG